MGNFYERFGYIYWKDAPRYVNNAVNSSSLNPI